MLLTNYDLYDLYAVFVLIRAYPSDQANALAVDAVKEVLDVPQAQFGSTNAIRSRLGLIPELDREKIDSHAVISLWPEDNIPYLREDSKPADTYVRLDGFTKGFVTVNGFNIGRYFNPAGPQKTLYVPAPLLRQGDNEIVVFESDGYELPVIEFTDVPELQVTE